MLKILGAILVCTTSTTAGFLYSQTFKKRTLQLKELERAIYQLQNEIIYTHTTLPDAIFNIYTKSIEPLKNIFKKISLILYSNEVDTVYEAFYKSFNEEKDSINLNKEDIAVIMDLAKTLGESDIEGQKKVFLLTLENLKKQINVAEISMGKNMKMYKYLGFSLGAIVVIMLI